MGLTARRLGNAVSMEARARIRALAPYPAIESWLNPLTRGLARHFSNQAFAKTLEQIDFAYRLSDADIGGVPCIVYETDNKTPGAPRLLYLHGGGMVSGSSRINASMILPACHLAGVEAVGVDYALVPEARYPTQINQIDAVYKAMRAERPHERIVLFGDSIGGGLALSCLLKWRAEGTPLPIAVVLVSPAVDAKGASDTYVTIDARDPLFGANASRGCRKLFGLYADGADIADPLISPIYGDLAGLPPMLIHAGTREVLLGDAARLNEKARKAGCDVTLRVFDGMFHLFQMYWSLSEAKTAQSDIADFIRRF
ncbi:MAG: alpha/beta hydrolase [Parvularculaceae bacterium]